jgi:hypothetical protein
MSVISQIPDVAQRVEASLQEYSVEPNTREEVAHLVESLIMIDSIGIDLDLGRSINMKNMVSSFVKCKFFSVEGEDYFV